MNASILDAKINHYRAKVKKLDSFLGKLPESKQAKYRSAKRRFEERLKAWQKTLGSDLAVFDNNVAEGYNELEAHFVGGNHR